MMVTKTDSSLIVHDGGTIKDVLDTAKPIANYTALRAYAGSATQVRITSNGISGFFYHDAPDTTSADNGGTIIVGGNGKRWKRIYSGPLNVRWFGATGDGSTDDTQAVNNAIQSLVFGGEILFSDKTYFCNSGIVVSNNNIRFVFSGGAGITFSTANSSRITVNGNDFQMVGASITGPASFDATNSRLTYGIVTVTGERATFDRCSLFNIYRSGIFFSNTNNGKVVNCYIDGGMIEEGFTGANTVHFGVAIDPNSTGSQGSFVIANNTIKRCVQGGGSGNLDVASYEQAISVTGNVFEECWNHGWYSSGIANGVTITGNAFSGCQIPIALTGNYHVVTGNTLIVQSTGTGAATDNELTGISLRDPYGCIVTGNTIKGEGTSAGAVISLEDFSGAAGKNVVENNVVCNNIIEITNSTVAGVGAIRFIAPSTRVKNNLCCNNIIVAPVRSIYGLITFVAGAGTDSTGNVIDNNTIVFNGAAGGAFGIYCVNISDSDISNNRLRIEFDSAVARIITSIHFEACARVSVRSNVVRCSAAFGANVTIRGIFEVVSGSGSEVSDNRFDIDTTKASASNLLALLSTSGVFVRQSGTGTPEGVVVGAVGSEWRRKDGAAGSSFYVKETGTGNTGWVAK